MAETTEKSLLDLDFASLGVQLQSDMCEFAQ